MSQILSNCSINDKCVNCEVIQLDQISYYVNMNEWNLIYYMRVVNDQRLQRVIVNEYWLARGLLYATVIYENKSYASINDYIIKFILDGIPCNEKKMELCKGIPLS